MTALNLYGTNTASGTLSTAASLVTGTGATSISPSSFQIPKGTTGWTECYSLSTNTTTYVASMGTPSGHGFLYDTTALEGLTINAGNWTPKFVINVGSKSITGTLTINWYRYNAGSYVNIGSQTSSSFSGANAVTPTFTTTSLGSVAFSTGDKLYFDVWLNITSGWTGSGSTQTGTVQLGNSATQGFAGAAELDTPGYSSAGVSLAGSSSGLSTASATVTHSTVLTGEADGVATSDRKSTRLNSSHLH